MRTGLQVMPGSALFSGDRCVADISGHHHGLNQFYLVGMRANTRALATDHAWQSGAKRENLGGVCLAGAVLSTQTLSGPSISWQVHATPERCRVMLVRSIICETSVS